MNHILRIGSRKSVLALRQAEMIAEQLKNKFPGLQTEILTRDTLGDRLLHSPLQAFGGKGAFVSEFEQALLEGSIDLAVHSAKDMPFSLPEGLVISALSEREDPGDVLILPKTALKTEKKELVIGTSSPRRQLQIREQWQSICGSTKWLDKESRPVCRTLRGNVQTRLKKLQEGACDGILLAAAGLKRLGIEEGKEWHFIRRVRNSFCLPGDRGSLQWRQKRIQRLRDSAARSTADPPVCVLQQKGECLKRFRQAVMRRWPYMRTSLKKMEKRNCAFAGSMNRNTLRSLRTRSLKKRYAGLTCAEHFQKYQ